MSRPRREWWSLLCSRRCSVRWLMRSVSSATCTLVEPVSFSLDPKRAAISRLRSLVIAVMSAATVAEPSRRQASSGGLACGKRLARALDVAVHLGDERLRAGKAPLAAQALDEVKPQLAPVEVALEVQQIGLDQLAAARLEGGAHADADGRRTAVGEAGIDAVARAGQGLVGDQVGGRKAQLTATFVAAHDLAAELEGRPQQAVGGGHVAGQH